MKYMIGFYEPADAIAKRDRNDEGFWGEWRAFFAELDAAGLIVDGAPLQNVENAVTTRVAGSERMVQDGPYADTKEQLAGFVVIDVPSLDEALAWAKKCPSARYGAAEVRPVLPPANEQQAQRPERRGSYMLSIYETADGFGRREGPGSETYWSAWAAYASALRESGRLTSGAALREAATATTIRTIGNDFVVHDGPYADTKEQLGGYLLLDVPSVDDAIAWAARCPAASMGSVEVRPVLRVPAPV